jgi:hypothetical protein
MPVIVYLMLGGRSWLRAGPAFAGASKKKLLEARTMISQRALPAPALCLSQDHCCETTSLTPAFVRSSDRPPTLLRSRRNVKQSDLGLSF